MKDAAAQTPDPAAGAELVGASLRRAARQGLGETGWVLKKHGPSLAPPLRDRLATLRQRIEQALETGDEVSLRSAYDEATDCLEHEAAPFRKSVLREYAEVIVLALALALFSRTFMIQAFKIPSGSMIPTLLVGDYLIVSKLAYGIKNPAGGWLVQWDEPERGDVVVFITPEDKDRSFFDRRDFIKRVIAVGGETVEFRNRTLLINGQAVEDPWGRYATGPAFDRPAYGPVLVPEGKLFVMGDNRNDSSDSREWGFVPMEMVVGKAEVLYFSIARSLLGIRWNRLGRLIE